ncbi:MAG TPA: hypothetical protein VGQ14_02020 [Candidatus Eisenbacteria bacterium]|jgi:hypothetical protein|nr:hypothetical protein [Candidatus Eisenbacteria bacterium]
MIGLLFRFLSRYAFRFLFTILLFAITNLLGLGRARETQKGFRRFGGDSGTPGGDAGGRASPGRSGSRPPIDRSDAVDVPFTEVPPAGEAPTQQSPGEAGRGT